MDFYHELKIHIVSVYDFLYRIKVQNKSCIFPIEISDKALHFIITASLRLKMARNAGNCIIFAGKS